MNCLIPRLAVFFGSVVAGFSTVRALTASVSVMRGESETLLLRSKRWVADRLVSITLVYALFRRLYPPAAILTPRRRNRCIPHDSVKIPVNTIGAASFGGCCAQFLSVFHRLLSRSPVINNLHRQLNISPVHIFRVATCRTTAFKKRNVS